ncbi:TonB-dependent receptor [Leptospira perolatii]|uniref:TonB-dependent receptor n=1 Tax=Leptospira perolatii TaxID=2023191 RepID=A0A2M9ZII8_9LEPT|nr:TonB-dependent receptor [Leptospira perolatii]PJZ68226.1 TonB-dependent receptor [Leptospira perolatii]PJZ71773.1 TonB-dependent receptor [Leptospira perolatii]
MVQRNKKLKIVYNKFINYKFILIYCAVFSAATEPVTAKDKTVLRISVVSPDDKPLKISVKGEGFFDQKVIGEDFNAEFILPQAGKYEVIVLFYSQEQLKRIATVSSNFEQINIQKREKTNSQKNGINVIGKREGLPPSYSISQEEAVRMPGGYGDAVRAIQSLPGITPLFQTYTGSSFQSALTGLTRSRVLTSPDQPNSERGFLVMRGAGTRANQFFFNGLPLTYPFHADGLSSVINNNAIRTLEIYSGAYSARYGFATGGIINIEGPNKRESDLSVININAFLTDAYFYKNINEKVNVSVSGRKYYPNVILSRVPDLLPGKTLVSDFGDFQTRLSWELNREHSFSLHAFGAKDRRYPFKSLEQYSPKQAAQAGFQGLPDSSKLERNFHTEGLQYIWKPIQRLTSVFNLARNYFTEITEDSTEMLELDPAKRSTITSVYEKINTIRNDFFYDLRYFENVSDFEILKNTWKISFGGQYRETLSGFKGHISKYNPSPRYTDIQNLIFSDPITGAVLEGDTTKTRQIGTFFENRFRIRNSNLNLGVRREFYDRSGEWKTAPRISFSQEIEPTNSRLFAGYGKHYQAPSDVSRYSVKTGNPDLKMEESDHYEIGVEQKISELWNLKIEGFRNTFKNLVVEDPYIQDPFSRNRDLKLEFLNPNSDPSLYRTHNLRYSNSMSGFSEGIEVFLKKEPTNETGLFFWLSYTKSVSKRNRNQPDLTFQEQMARTAAHLGKELAFQDVSRYFYTNVYKDGTTEFLFKNSKEELYDLDRTHVLSLVAGWKYKNISQIGIRFTYLTNYAYTPIVDSKVIDLVSGGAGLPPLPPPPPGASPITFYAPIYSDLRRSARLPQYNQIDLRIDRFIPTEWGKMTLYLELVNITGNQVAVSNGDLIAFVPYIPGKNPKTSYINSNGFEAGKNKIPFINFGIELRF